MTPTTTMRRGGLVELLLGQPTEGPWHAQLRTVAKDLALAAGYAACGLAVVMLALLVSWLAIYAAFRIPHIA